MAPAVKKMKMEAGGAVAYAEPDVNDELKREDENENDEGSDDEDESPMSIIAQFQSEDVRGACMSWCMCRSMR